MDIARVLDVRDLTVVRDDGAVIGFSYVSKEGAERRVRPGKYIRKLSTTCIGIEGQIEEFGEEPDWDFDEPRIYLVDVELGWSRSRAYLDIYNDLDQGIDLVYRGRRIARVGPHRIARIYLDVPRGWVHEYGPTALAAAIGAVALLIILR